MKGDIRRIFLCFKIVNTKLGGENPVNVRKQMDYSAMFMAQDALVAAGLPQMELYCEIGRLVSGRLEKCAAVMAAEYLHNTRPDTS